jgi:hypothetical protein
LKPKSARTMVSSLDIFFVSYPAISHSSRTHARTHTHTQAKLLLPMDLHYDLAALTKLFQKPAMRVRLTLASSSSSLGPVQQVGRSVGRSVNGKRLVGRSVVGRSVNGVRLVGRSVVGRSVLCSAVRWCCAVELRWCCAVVLWCCGVLFYMSACTASRGRNGGRYLDRLLLHKFECSKKDT